MEDRRSTRLAESRQNEMLKQYDMGYVSPLAMPTGVAREGFSYCWANKETPHQVEMMCRQGWEVVPSDRAPSYALDPLKRNENYNAFFWWGDAILMEIPEVLHQRIKSHNQSLADAPMRSLQGVYTDTAMYATPIRGGISSF